MLMEVLKRIPTCIAYTWVCVCIHEEHGHTDMYTDTVLC